MFEAMTCPACRNPLVDVTNGVLARHRRGDGGAGSCSAAGTPAAKAAAKLQKGQPIQAAAVRKTMRRLNIR